MARPAVGNLVAQLDTRLTARQALQLAAVLGMLPPRVVIFGIEAAAWETGRELSDAVAEAVPSFLNASARS